MSRADLASAINQGVLARSQQPSGVSPAPIDQQGIQAELDALVSLPRLHPGTVPGVWLAQGDSQTSGQTVGVGQDYPSQTVPFLGRAILTRINVAVGGATVPDMIAAQPAANAYRVSNASWTVGRARNLFSCMGGLNTGGASAAQIQASLTTLFQDAATGGWETRVISTIVGSNHATILAVNAWIRLQPLGTLWHAVADPASDPRMQTLALPWFSDGVHMSPAGMTLCAGYFADAIRRAAEL